MANALTCISGAKKEGEGATKAKGRRMKERLKGRRLKVKGRGKDEGATAKRDRLYEITLGDLLSTEKGIALADLLPLEA